MKRINSMIAGKSWSKIWVLPVLLLIFFMISACASVNIDAAKALSKTGRSVVVQAQQNTMISDKEYFRALDSEAFLHGYSGTQSSPLYEKLLNLYKDIQKELAKRSVVFDKLADLYDTFGELAGLDAGTQTEKALGDLGGAISGYATQIKQPVPLLSDATGLISKIGGIISTEIQKNKIKEASILTREKVDAFQQLLGNKLVRSQVTDFRKLLASDRNAAFYILWDAGLYDPKPFLDDFGTDAGLVSKNNASELIKSNKNADALNNALKEVINKRLSKNNFDLIEKSYDVSLAALKNLVSEHKKLEQGEQLDLTRLQAIVSELRSIVVLLGNAKKDTSISK